MRSNSVGYFSSYDRGLECLLKMWPQVHEQVPDATLDIYYGWNSFDMVHKTNPEMNRWKWSIIRDISKLKDKGVLEHGRVSHEELAEVMGKIKVWAYPTEFNEINCITALKTQAAGCIPVTTGCYALKETVLNHEYTTKVKDIYSNETAQANFVKELVRALRSDDWVKPDLSAYTWDNLATQWSEALK